MLFNLDKEAKKNVFENYRREALISSLKKIEQRKKEKEEDKINLEQKEQRQIKIIELINKEKLEEKEKIKKEYYLMLERTKGFFPRKKQLILKNYGQKKEPYILPELHSNFPSNTNKRTNNILINNYNFNNFESLSRNEKEKEILKQVDHMNELLTDKQNDNEMSQYFQKRKENKYLFYKDLLFSQYKDSINKNFNLYGTKDELLIKQKKKKILTENPFIYNKKSYNFGASTLSHNPITNPENDYNYNKYIDYQSYKLTPGNSRNYNSLYKLNSVPNLKYINSCNEIDINDNRINNYNNLNNNISKNHTIDINDINGRNKLPLTISRCNSNIINNEITNKVNTPILKKNLSQSNIYPFQV